ncbi:hypothetical protein NP493_1451g01041 [Ridgeia piscesae]|uniref:Calcitonin receptor n=1 Tax=Ridgeia piscesae TaxID=27915 RepID=A0AAD9K2E5_RIDPI|nr:hypothetical protein NP493_1451g01041 [Ridgeia piscesae]
MARVCAASLSNDECARWRACCSAAVDCCDAQLREPRSDDDDRNCARTWDGYRCWWETRPGQVATTSCPAFVEHSITTRRAVKQCTLNGTWYEKNGMAWTDYTACLDRESYMVGVYICVACSGLSITLLLPAVVIFFIFRDLYKQHRVRLHINFFLALALQGVASILWYGLVHYDLFVHTSSTSTVLHRNPLWCRLLSFSKIYFASATYFWMFCEGYFLHRLISKAFEPPKTLIWLFLFGWGMPLIPTVIYSIVRGSIANDSCWAISVNDYEWIVYAPNLFCLVVNLLFLSNILRILLFQLHSHPHEPSNFR